MENDLISRQAAIDALGDEPEVWTGKDEYAQGLNNQWHYDKNAILAVPSAQPYERMLHESCTDCPLYDQNRHSCPRFNKVIPETLREVQPEQRWIPCSEGLPTIETDVLVTAHNGTTQYVAWMDAFEKWHSDEEEVIKGYEPLAWMPLPEPYKLERGEQDE